jgi:DNA-binding transcriptional regulator LsrR (DeoR family)
MIAAAYLRGQGHSQVRIASQLRLPQPEVSRLLKVAIRERLLNPRPSFDAKQVAESDWAEVERDYFSDESLVERLRKRASKVHVSLRIFHGGYDEFAHAAAGRVLDLVQNSRMVGIMWGRTIANAIAGIDAICRDSPHPHLRHINCIPLCGDPVHLMNQREMEYSASQLAASLQQIIAGRRSEKLPCLNGVPAYVSAKIMGGTFLEFLHSIPGYNQIFRPADDDPPLVDRVDTVLTGVGITALRGRREPYETAAFIRERVAQENISLDDLNELVLGDIGGILIERPDLSVTEQQRVVRLNSGWIGIKKQHLQRISRDAGPDAAPGIVVIAYGPSKAELCAELVRQRLVNELIVDKTLATRLNEVA